MNKLKIQKLGKIFLKQGIIIAIALSFFAVPIIIGEYVNNHVIHPCSINDVLSQTCSYDNSVASWLNSTRNWYATTSFFRTQIYFNWLVNFFTSSITGQYNSVVPSFINLFIIIFALNTLHFSLTTKDQKKF